MDTESLSLEERARNIEAVLLRAIRSTGQKHVAKAIGISEGQFSKLKDEGLIARCALVLSAADMKIVPTDAKCYRPEYIDPIFQIAKHAMERAKTAEEMLLWDDPE